MHLAFTTLGVPVPQGSHRVIRNRVIPDPRLLAWRELVTRDALVAARAVGWTEPLDAPCVLRLQFWLPAPKRPRWPSPATKPDLDKLVRAIGDALSPREPRHRVLAEDSRIVSLHAEKTYVTESKPAGVRVLLSPIGP